MASGLDNSGAERNMKIETERLILREFRDDDYDALREIHSDPEVFRYRSRACFDEAMTRGFLTRAQRAICEEPRNAYAFAIRLREDGLLIGECGMNRVDSGCNETYLWNSLNRRFWRQGYMTESLKALLKWGFVDLGLRRISAECDPGNLSRSHNEYGRAQGYA